jgi:uncharacterized protein (DUF1684 family)
MKHQTAVILKVVSLSLLLVCATCSKATRPAAQFDEAAHKLEVQQWQSKRLTNLTSSDGWLTLVGLFWLNEGENKFGSDPKNAVVLPKGKAPGAAGSLWVKEGKVRLTAPPESKISVALPANVAVNRVDGKPLTSLDLKDDTEDAGPTVFEVGSLRINVIKRGDRIGVRVKDSLSQTLLEFKGLQYFPIDPKWRIEARFEPYQPPKTIPITNVLSMTDDEISPGAFVFEVNGKTYRIDPILEKGETDLFVMIADETTGKETYGAGRYLYVTPPDATGKVVIDFNKAYSPPCAFTNFATCPLPPQQNRLPFRIEAGEKKYAGTVH